jgi:hypothetical protein
LPCTDGNQSQAQNRFHRIGEALCFGRQAAFVPIGTVELAHLAQLRSTASQVYVHVSGKHYLATCGTTISWARPNSRRNWLHLVQVIGGIVRFPEFSFLSSRHFRYTGHGHFTLSPSFSTIIFFLSVSHVPRRDDVKHGVVLPIQDYEQVTPAGGLSVDVVALATTTPLKPRIVPDDVFDLFRLYLMGSKMFHIAFIPNEVFNVHSFALP